MELRIGAHTLDLARPQVMGILNRTPDSFSDGGAFTDFDTALRHAAQMASEGAAVIDIGGESTRPGAVAVSVQQELDRVIPLIERLSRELDVPLSVDTSKPEVMRAAIKAGAAMINDVYGLRQSGALEAARDCGVPVCLMHMQGEPRTMQHEPRYDDVVTEVKQFLAQRVQVCIAAGLPAASIIIDPGFGFGKNLVHNLVLLGRLSELASLGQPLLVGLSRKSMLGSLLGGAPAGQRMHASVAAAVIAVQQGACVVRCHDVAPTVEALKVVTAVHELDRPGDQE